MKHAGLIILLLGISITVRSQDAYEKFVAAFAGNYNAQNFAASYDLNSASFNAQVTKDYFVQILSGAYASSGKITEVKQVQSNGQGKVFHLIGERATFELSVALDAAGKAAGLFIRPAAQAGPADAPTAIERWKSNKLNAGLVVGRIRDGQADVQYMGVSNRQTSAPVDANSIFEIGSISKPFTGILLQELIAEKKISLDDPVNKFLPKGSQLAKVNGDDILIKHLITHSSCLPRMPSNMNPPPAEAGNPYNHYSDNMLLEFLPTVEAAAGCDLGKTSTYSNLGAGLVGYILTKVSGKSYSDLIKERIAKPLKTESFGVTGASPNWTQGYTTGGEPQQQWTFTDALVGAGGVDASPNDMIKLLSFLMKPDESPLGKAVQASTVVQQGDLKNGIATFWIRQEVAGKPVVWHNGLTGGYNAFIGWIKGTQTGVFVLSNNGEDVATQLGLAILGEEK